MSTGAGTGLKSVVVGAGLSGLAAAYRLQQAGVNVTVLERGNAPGGRAQTEEHGGYLVDTGADALTGSYQTYLGLLGELGLSDRLVNCSRVVGLARGGRIVDIDPRRPWRLVGSRALSFRAKLGIAYGYLRLRRMLRDVDSYELVRSAELDDPHTTAYDFAARHFGTEVAEYLIDPVMRLTTGSGARQASCLNVLGALASWAAPAINVRGGLRVLPIELAKRVPTRYGATVTGIDGTADGIRVSYTDADGEPHVIEADGCVIGAMYDAGIEIWPALSAFSPNFNEQLRSVKLVSVSLGYRVRMRSEAYIVQVPTVEEPDALLIFLQHNKAPDRAPDGHSLITIYTDTSATDRYLQKTDEGIISWAAGIVERLCPELAGQRDLGVVTRWPKAGYLATPGFWRRSATLLEALPADGRVQVAGDLFGAGSMESAVRWGQRAAQRLLQQARPMEGSP